MTIFSRLALALVLISGAAQAQASPKCQPTDDTVCVPKVDLRRFLEIVEERACLDRTRPEFQLDEVVVLTDTDGRVFYSGADSKKPYKLVMKWCHYTVEAAGKIDLVAALATPETWGFRFRPKAYLGYLPFKLSKGRFNEGIDAGIMIDWFFIDWVNLNVAAGFRSVGLDVGIDLTGNFGLSVGGGLLWSSFDPALRTSLWFAF
jgi:hypothetical protein